MLQWHDRLVQSRNRCFGLFRSHISDLYLALKKDDSALINIKTKGLKLLTYIRKLVLPAVAKAVLVSFSSFYQFQAFLLQTNVCTRLFVSSTGVQR